MYVPYVHLGAREATIHSVNVERKDHESPFNTVSKRETEHATKNKSRFSSLAISVRGPIR